MKNIYYETATEWQLDQQKFMEHMQKHGPASLNVHKKSFDPEEYVTHLSAAALTHYDEWGSSIAWNRRTSHAIRKARKALAASKPRKAPPADHGMGKDGKQKKVDVETPSKPVVEKERKLTTGGLPTSK